MSRRIIHPVLKLTLGLLVAAVAVTALILAATGRLAFWENWNLPGRADTVIRTETINEDIMSIDVNWDSGTVVINPGDDDQILLVEKAARDDVDALLSYTVSGGQLQVESLDNDGWFFRNWFTGERRLEITLPQKMYEQVAVHLTSGSCILADTQAESFKLYTTSGSVKLDGVQADELLVRITSGGVTATDMSAGYLDMEITSGKANVSGSLDQIQARIESGSADITCAELPESLDAHVTSGRLKIRLPENEGFSTTVGITSGRFDSEFEMVQTGGRYTYLDGGPEYDLSCKSGGVDLIRTEP